MSKDLELYPEKAHNLWQEAALLVEPKLQARLQNLSDFSCGPDGLLNLVREKRDECKAKQWTCKNIHGQRVYIRDVLESCTYWLDKLKSVGDVVSSFDPVHAALPWAGARFLLTVATSDIKQHGAMMESLEVIISTISRYTLLEQLYCRQCVTKAEGEVRKSIIRVYAAILGFLGKANDYFNQNVAKRIVLSLSQLGQDSDVLGHEVQMKDAELQKWTPLVDKELQDSSKSQLSNMIQEVTQLKAILQELEHPLAYMTFTLDKVQDGLESSERMRIMKWISTELYLSHHKTIASHRLEGSGAWLLNKQQYRQWKYTTRCPFLWLNGGPGSGKSILTSLVIDDLLKELTNQHNAPPIAYFYCSRDSSEPRRGSALEILLSILKQLACSLADEPLFPAVAAKWQERMNSGCEDRLDVQEAVDIIIQISSLRGAFIVVDALDECPKKQRQILLEKLDIIGQKSVSLVRIFASSRPNSDIREYFRKTPRLEILAKTNSGDIEDYVKSELENRIKTRKFLDGHPSPEIVTMVSESLIEQADGIFRWVSASIETLCGLSHEADVIQALETLPTELNGVYAIIISQINEGGPVTKELAKKALCWLLCCQKPLTTSEFINALSNDPDIPVANEKIDKQYVLDMMCNLVKHDAELDVIRFVHLSVREYLEKLPEYEKSKRHASVALTCLRSCRKGQKPKRRADGETKLFYDYATIYWPVHCSSAKRYRREGKLQRALDDFLYQDRRPSRYFRDWLNTWGESWDALGLNDTAVVNLHKGLKDQLLDSESGPPNPAFLACAFGFLEILQDKRKFDERDLQKKNRRNRDPFNVAISHDQKELVDHFTSVLHYNAEESGEVPLITAVLMNRYEMVRKLLDESDSMNVSQNLIEWAVVNSSLEIVNFLTNHERAIDWDVTPRLLQYACANTVDGDKVVEFLLDRDQFVEIDDDTIDASCDNIKFGTTILCMLLDRNPECTVTSGIVETACLNGQLGAALLDILFTREPDIKISSRMIEFAAINASLEPIKMLLAKEPNAQTSCTWLYNAVNNADVGDKVLPLCLSRCSSNLIDASLIIEASSNGKFGPEMVKMLLDKSSRAQLPITTEILHEACRSRFGERMLKVLLPACPGMPIHYQVGVITCGNMFSPVEILQLLLEHDPAVEITVDACIMAVNNSQYAIELLDFLEPRCGDIIRDHRVLEELAYNDTSGLEMIKRFWTTESKPEVTKKAVEYAATNRLDGDKILAHWYSLKCPITIPPTAVEFAMNSILAAEVLRAFLRVDKKLKFTPKAISNACGNETRAPVLIKAIIKHLGKGKLVATDEMFSSASANFETGAEVISILISECTFSVTPAVIESIACWRFDAANWAALLGITRQAAITSDALEYALRYQQQLLPCLNVLLSKNPTIKFTEVCWEWVLANQTSAETMMATLDCLAKHDKKLIISERVLCALVTSNYPMKILPKLQDYAEETHQELPITTEVIHTCIGVWDEKRNPIIEHFFEMLAQASKTIEITDELCAAIMSNSQAQALVEMFMEHGYHIPAASNDTSYMELAIANWKLKDETLEELFDIDPQERIQLLKIEQKLNALIDIKMDRVSLQKVFAKAGGYVPISVKVLLKVLKTENSPVLWIEQAAQQDPEKISSLVTEEVVIAACKQSFLANLPLIALQHNFKLPITAKVMEAAARGSLYVFRIVLRQIYDEGGTAKLLEVLNKQCLKSLASSEASLAGIGLLKTYISKEDLLSLYSEAMLTRAAACSDMAFVEELHPYVPDAKPIEHYRDISDFQIAGWNQDAIKLRQLLNKGLHPNHKNSDNMTVLASASYYGELCSVKLLMRYPEVDINVADDYGRTALILAAVRGHYAVVEALLNRGAERHHRETTYARTAEDWAREEGHYAMAKYIRTFKKDHTADTPDTEFDRVPTWPLEGKFALKKRMTSKW